jgi:hypothetical protein
LLVHIGDPSSNQATSLESQMIHMIQELFGQTLRPNYDISLVKVACRENSFIAQLQRNRSKATHCGSRFIAFQ